MEIKEIGYRSIFRDLALVVVIGLVQHVHIDEPVFIMLFMLGAFAVLAICFFKIIAIYPDAFVVRSILNPFIRTYSFEYKNISKVVVLKQGSKFSHVNITVHHKNGKDEFMTSFSRAEYMDFVNLIKNYVEVTLHDGHTKFDGYIK